ncbi:MAG TPA: hypothetical protein VF018_11980, partial [Acidobacteriaceae bacterium]
GGTMKGREVAVGTDGTCEDAVECFEEWKALGTHSRRGEALGFCKDEGGGFSVGEDGVHCGSYFALVEKER